MTQPPPPSLSVSGPSESPKSAVDALMPAWENTKRVLFEPFTLRKWLKLALIAFIAGVVSGGGGGGGPSGNMGGGGPGGSSGPDAPQVWEQIVAWYHAHTNEIIIGIVALGTLVFTIGILMTYVSSIFRFIFMESVITSETRIRESWRRNRAQGLSYFWWRIGFGLVALLILAIVIGGPIALILTSIGWTPSSGPPDPSAILASVGLVLLAIFLGVIAAIIIAIVKAMTQDFVLPLMYVRRIGVLDAWGNYWRILCDNKLGFLIYFLIKIVVTVLAGIASLFVGCLGLLVAAIPIAILLGIGYLLVLALGITSWSWTYLWGIVPVGLIVAIGLGYWMTCVVLPIPVYYQSYALKYLGYAEPEAATI